MKRQTVSGPNLARAITADAAIIDEKSRRVRLSFSSEIPYLRNSLFDDPWIEVLGHDEGEIVMDRIGSGNAPLLWGHDQFERENNIGVVEKAWTQNGRGMAEVRLSARPDMDGLMQDLVDGIVRNVSVGYQIHERTLVNKNDSGPSEYRVTRWTPLEISLVSVPADETVGVGRNAEALRSFTVTDIPQPEERNMSDEQKPAVPAITERQESVAAQVVSAPSDMTRSIAEASYAAVNAERARVSEITKLARKADMDEDTVRKFVDDGATVEGVRAAVLDALVSRDQAHRPQMTAGRDSIDKENDQALHALLARAGERIDGKVIDLQGNDFRSASLLDLAKRSLERVGVRTNGLDKMEIAARAITQTTSDFPILMGNVLNKSLLGAYALVPDTWRLFCKVGSASDFRPNYRYRGGAFGNLATVPENGEYTYGSIGDAERNPITVATKGKMIGLSRQAIINDDLGALVDMAQIVGRSSARTLESDVYTYLASNPTLADTGALFNSTAVTTAGGHANISSYVAPSVTSIALQGQLMASQTYAGDYIDVRPTIFLGPIGLAADVQLLNDSQFDPADSKFMKPNMVRGFFSKVIGSPRITGSVWYVFADPNIEPVLEVAFLNGQQSPYLEMRQGWNVDGVEWKVRLDYGVGAVGFRGGRKVV